ncbi:hypothetical protein TNCV_2285921 [Trichonephila clavipes]|nr:hypothetical protein TNCV_2285921 [Trichonephila clavipes]
MAPRMKKGKKKKNVAEKTCLPKMEKEEEFEFDIGALSLAELVHLADGYVDDPSEETVIMTRREMNMYIKEKMTEYSKDPKVNPFIDLQKQCRILLKEIKEKEQQLLKAQKDFEIMYKDQLKFLRRMGIVPKEPAKSVGVSADFPILPESLPCREFLAKGGYFGDLPICKILTPSKNLKSASKQHADIKEPIPVSNVEVDLPTCKILTPSTNPKSASKQRADIKEPIPVSNVEVDLPTCKILTPSTNPKSASKQRADTKSEPIPVSNVEVDLPSCKILTPSTNPKSTSKQRADTKSEPIPVSNVEVECVDIASD